MKTKTFLQKSRQANSLSLLTGALMPLAFAPFDIYPIAFIGPAILFFLWLDQPVKVAFQRGYFFGMGMFGLGVPWVYVSMSQFGGVAPPIAAILTALFVLFLALFPAFTGYFFARFFAKLTTNIKLLVVLPALWTTSEWIRGWIFTGFPWLSLGYSQIDAPLKGFAPIMGVYGISWLTVVISGLLALLVVRREKRILYFEVPILLVIIGLGIGLERIHWTHSIGHPIKVALLQGNISQDLKWRSDQRQPTIDLYTKMTRANLDSDLIVWPETALPAFYHQAKNYLTELGNEAKETKTDLLIGIPIMDLKTRRYFNSVVEVGVGPVDEIYNKSHLVPFGEYIPLRGILGNIFDILNVPLPNFSTAEAAQHPLTAAGYKVGISICYEDAFGEEVIKSLPEANFLVNVSNDAWFGHSVAPNQHLQIARMRAVETGRPLLRATNTGITAVIDDEGAIKSRLPQFVANSLTDTIQPMIGATPYSKYGNGMIILILTVLLALGIYQVRKKGND